MKVYVVGAGAVGTFLAERLRDDNTTIEFAPRKLQDVVPVHADLAIVAVKAYDTDKAIATLQRALGPSSGATIMTPQNGVGNEEKLAAAFGADAIVSCALTVPVDRLRNGSYEVKNDGGVALAPVGKTSHNWLVAAFERGHVPVKTVEDYRAMKWSKLALNIVANASCAILNVLPERLLDMEHMFSLEVRAMRETAAVMRAMKLGPVDLPRYPVRALQSVIALPSPMAKLVIGRRIAGARGRKPPSLLLDLRAAKGQTEVDVLNGAVVDAGRRLGVPTPINAVFARVLDDISHMPQLWAKYRERPQALYAEVLAENKRSHASGARAR
ncbi:MAG: ketopantoate reductase family protein [Candidatus Eremiobacteraeota bacterium]|nr:ketopantoate reductase family protein [Candidatus Eremiobacteraeota bacterium]